MQKLINYLKRFFLPSEDAPLWLRLLPFAILGVLTVFVLSASVQVWNHTNSSEFCGTACHTMPPEYSAYLRSPHARVQCVECHIGRDVITTQITRKAGDLRHVVFNLTKAYEFPIRAHEMRPARESCERCHFPEKFSDDSLREIQSFMSDESNSPQSLFLIMKTGGGSEREGLGRGIHWHIENEVYYLATDDLEQEIPYVRVVDGDGAIQEFYDISSGIGPEDVAGQYLEQMDCITCHNRITHAVPQPEEAVDQALSKGLISSNLPFVRERSIALLRTEYADKTTAMGSFSALADFYLDQYPEVYETQEKAIGLAISALEDIYDQNVFPDQKSDWDTHNDNLGHKNDPGCFRCHDGNHISPQDEAIRLECNICHSIPIVSDADALVTDIELVSGPEPVSHTHSSWIALHGSAIDTSCAACHPPVDLSLDYVALQGKPPSDGSFCGNSACHVSEWEYTGFDDPALAPILERQLYALQNSSPFLSPDAPLTYQGTFKTIFEGRCAACHSGVDATAGLDVTNYETLLAGGNNGNGILPGDPDNSVVYQRQNGVIDHFGQMLTDELVALQTWITEGAPEQ